MTVGATQRWSREPLSTASDWGSRCREATAMDSPVSPLAADAVPAMHLPCMQVDRTILFSLVALGYKLAVQIKGSGCWKDGHDVCIFLISTFRYNSH